MADYLEKFNIRISTFLNSVLILILLFFVVALLLIIYSYHNSVTSNIFQKEISAHEFNTTSIIKRTIDRYAIATSQIAASNYTKGLIDNPEKENEEAISFLMSVKTSFKTEEVFFLSNSGDVIYASAKDNFVLDSEEFKQLNILALEGKSAVAGFIDSKVFNVPVLYIVQAVRGENNSGSIVIGKVFNNEQMSVLFPNSETETRGVLLFSAKGQTVASSKDFLLFQNLLKSDINEEVIQEIQKGDEYNKIYNNPKFNGIIKISKVDFNTQIMRPFGFFIEASDLMRLESDFVIYSFFALILTILLIGGSIVVVKKRITDPVLRIEEGFKELTKNNYFYSIIPRGLWEIKEIGKGYNLATKTISDNFKKLEEKELELSESLEKSERINKLIVGRELKMIELKKEIMALKNKLEIK